MKAVFWIGLVIFALGIVSLFVPVPHSEKHGLDAGGLKVGIETRSQERVPAYVSAILLIGGVGMMIAGGKSQI